MAEYLLRTIMRVKSSDKKIHSDQWYRLQTHDDLIEKVFQIDPIEYQCFEVEEITGDIFFQVEKMHAEKEKEERRKLWEELSVEFAEEESEVQNG